MKIKDGFVLRQIAGEWMAVAVGTRTAEFPGIIALSETAAFIWEQLKNDITFDQLIEALTSEFEVKRETAINDLEIFIALLKEKELLKDE